METIGLPSIVLMENAAIGAAALAMRLLGGKPGAVVVVCGSGENGGDGYAMARHLLLSGCTVQLVAVASPRGGSAAATNAQAAARLGIPISANLATIDTPRRSLVVDCIFGIGLDRPVSGPAREAIERINACRDAGATVLAIDVPSGLCPLTGAVMGVAVRANVTATMGVTKPGFAAPGAAEFTGRVEVVSIGVPPPP